VQGGNGSDEMYHVTADQKAGLDAAAGGMSGSNPPVLADELAALDLSARSLLTFVEYTDNHTFEFNAAILLSDHNPAKNHVLTGAAAKAFTIDTYANQPFPIGAQLIGGQWGTGVATITAAAGVLLNNVDGGSYQVALQDGAFYIRQRAVDDWWIGGDVIPVP